MAVEIKSVTQCDGGGHTTVEATIDGVPVKVSFGTEEAFGDPEDVNQRVLGVLRETIREKVPDAKVATDVQWEALPAAVISVDEVAK